MRTVDEFQRGLIDPSLVADPPLGPGPVTNSHLLEAPVTAMRNGVPTTISIAVTKESPNFLAAQAGVSPEVYSLARVMKSEGYGGPVDQKARAIIAIGQAVRRMAMGKFPLDATPITRLLTASTFSIARNRYGEQGGRYASTRLDPKPWHIEVAKAILDDDLPEIVPRSTKFLDPWTPGATQRGRKLPDFVKVMEDWHRKDHYAWVGPVDGIDTGALAFFYPEPSMPIREENLAKIIKSYRSRFPREPEGPQGA